METPTFLTKEERKARKTLGVDKKKEEPPATRHQDPEPEGTKPTARASVKEKIENINRKTSNSPGKFPELR